MAERSAPRTAGIFLCWMLAVLWAPAGFAQTATPDGNNTSLTFVVSAVLQNNTDLRAAALRLDAMRQRPGQASALPNPMLSYGNDIEAGMETRYSLEQPVPGFGKRSIEGRMAEADAELMALDVEVMRLEKVMDAKSRFAKLHAARRTAALLRSETNLLAQMEAAIQTRYAAGGATQVEILKVASERTMTRQKLLKAEQDELATASSLNQLMSRPVQAAISTAPLHIPTNFIPDPIAMWQSAQQHNPDIARADKALGQSQLDRTRMRRAATPDWSVGVEYTDRKDSETMVMLMVGMELPIWWNRTGRGIREAALMASSAGAELESARTRVQSQIQEIGLCCARVQESLALYKSELIPQAEQRLALSQAGYESGTVDFMDMLESRRFLLTVQQMEAMAEAELAMELAKLERTMGITIETFVQSEGGGNKETSTVTGE